MSHVSVRLLLTTAFAAGSVLASAQGPPGSGAPRAPRPPAAPPAAEAPPVSNGGARDAAKIEVGEAGVSVYAVGADAHELCRRPRQAAPVRVW